MTATSHKTDLNDRILWYDGDSTVDEKYIMDAISKGNSLDGIFVNELTTEIKQYNSFIPADQEIKIKTDVATPKFDFTIPEEYLTLDVEKYVSKKLNDELKKYENSIEAKIKRIETTSIEMQLYEKLHLFDILRTLIYVINTFQDKNIVWGLGRGSSCASYVLYLIGVHDVDSVKYELDITEFLRT